MSALIVCAISGCSSGKGESSSSKAESAAATEATAATKTTVLPDGMDETIEANEFEGVIFAVEDGTCRRFADRFAVIIKRISRE